VDGYVSGTIPISGIPANADGSPADILAAWVYWETIVNDPQAFALGSAAPYKYGAKFRDHLCNALRFAAPIQADGAMRVVRRDNDAAIRFLRQRLHQSSAADLIRRRRKNKASARINAAAPSSNAEAAARLIGSNGLT